MLIYQCNTFLTELYTFSGLKDNITKNKNWEWHSGHHQYDAAYD